MNTFQIIYVVCIIIFLISLIVLLAGVVANNRKRYNTANKNPDNTCILINDIKDSNKLKLLLDSIKEQDYKVNMKDIFVILDKDDEMSKIVSEFYGINIINSNESNFMTKGYILSFAVEEILKRNKHYDIYFFINSNITLDKSYIKNMVISYTKGYNYGIGLKKPKEIYNGFILRRMLFNSIFNINNSIRMKEHKNIYLSSSAFYISSKIIDYYKTFPWHSLNISYEFSVNGMIEGYSSIYNKNAIYYEDISDDVIEYNNTRLLKMKGYIAIRKKNRKPLRRFKKKDASIFNELIGLNPLKIMLLSFIVFYSTIVINLFYRLSNNLAIGNHLIYTIAIPLGIYLALLLFTLVLLIKERINNKFKTRYFIQNLFFFQFFIISYIGIYINALLPNLKIDEFDNK